VFESGDGLGDGGIELGIVDFHQELAFLDPSAAVDLEGADVSRDLGVEGCELEGADTAGLIGGSDHSAAFGQNDGDLGEIFPWLRSFCGGGTRSIGFCITVPHEEVTSD
jgi:hypothetical protein